MNEGEHRTSNKNLIDALKNSINGILYAIKTQTNVKIHLAALIIVIVASVFFKLDKIEVLFVTFSCGLVFVAEMLNTAIEATVDLYTKEYNEKAKIAKDVGAGAVIMAVINALVVAFVVFFEKIINLL